MAASIFTVKTNEITGKHLILCSSVSDKWQKTLKTPKKVGVLRPQRLELTHFVTGSVIFLLFFMHFATYIPHPKPPFSQQVPLACWWLSGVFPHILLLLEHKIGCFVVVSMVFSCKSQCVRIVYIYQNHKKHN